MSDSLNAILILSYFPCSDFPGLLVCDEADFKEMHTTKINSVADTSTFFANVTGLQPEAPGLNPIYARLLPHADLFDFSFHVEQ